MKTDQDLRRDVEHALGYEPSLDERHIGVSADAGVITLTGEVSSYAEKLQAEHTAKKIFGVRAVADELNVNLPSAHVHSDREIAEAAVRALKWHTFVPEQNIQVTVRQGWLTLEGEVDWQFQRQNAVHAMQHLLGVKGVNNHIQIKPKVKMEAVKSNIEHALARQVQLEARELTVQTEGHTVILYGTVQSWAERDEAESAAWSAPGVWQVEDHLTVNP